MSNINAVKKRITDLKNLSASLKQKTQQNATVDYAIIKQILSATKANAQAGLTQNNQNTHKQQNSISNIFAQLINSPGRNSNSNKFLEKKDSQDLPTFQMYSKIKNQHQQNFPPLFSDHSRRHYSSISRLPSGRIQADPQQIIQNLQRQKQQLQRQIIFLKEQIRNVQTSNQKIKQQSWKQGIPYFTLEQDINIYFTRLQVPQQHYNKIDYNLIKIQLDLDNLTIVKKGKDNIKKLDLSYLHEVFYLGDTNMVLYFKANNQIQQKLFMNFNNNQDLHRWDLGIYINFKIVQSLKKDRLFDGQVQFGYQKIQQQFSPINQSSNNKVLEKVNSKVQIELEYEKLGYSEQVQQLNQAKKILADQNQKQKSQSKIEKQKNDYPPIQKKISDRQKIRKQSLSKSEHSDKHSQKSDSQNKVVKKQEKNQKFVQTQYLQPIQQKTERQDTSKFKPLVPNKVNQLQKQNQFRQKLKQPPNLNIQRPESNHQEQENNILAMKKQKQLKAACNNLTNGYNLIKYAEGGWNPRQKKIQLSLDNQFLLFKDTEKEKDIKKYSLGDIKSIQYRQIGAGIKKHVQKNKLNPDRFVTIFVNPNKRIQLGHTNILLMSQFVHDLSLIKQNHLKK